MNTASTASKEKYEFQARFPENYKDLISSLFFINGHQTIAQNFELFVVNRAFYVVFQNASEKDFTNVNGTFLKSTIFNNEFEKIKIIFYHIHQQLPLKDSVKYYKWNDFDGVDKNLKFSQHLSESYFFRNIQLHHFFRSGLCTFKRSFQRLCPLQLFIALSVVLE